MHILRPGARAVALSLGLLVGVPAGAGAQVADQLRCYKITDPLRLKGIAEFASPALGLEPGCTLKRGAFYCVPGTKTVVEATEHGAPIPLLPLGGHPLQDKRICYKFKCDGTPPAQDVTDQFGARTLALKGVGLLCTPVFDGLLQNPQCGNDADCDDGDPCNGFERCANFQCQTGTPIGCQPGDMVFVAPFQGAPQPAAADLAATPAAQNVDVYLVIDRSASMSVELSSLKNNAATVLNNLTCPPAGGGTPGACIPSLWGGAGTSGYAAAAGSYTHHVDVQPNPNFAGVPTTEPSGCCNDTQLLAAWSTVTGLGSASASCGVTPDYAARASCTASPAGNQGVGYPCFRSDSLPLVVVATDEAPTTNLNCPTIPVTAAAANVISARVIGLLGSGSTAPVRTDLEALATQTGAVDASLTPLVFDAPDANATSVLQATLAAAYDAPIDTRAVLRDDPSDSVDAVAAFADRVETLQLGTAACSASLTDQDSGTDGFADEYVRLARGTPVCWRVRAKTNATVGATAQAQVFLATLGVEGARRATMGTRRVLFVVPPAS